MTIFTNLTNQFLIAMPNMDDPNFAQTVTYVCEHNENGAIGLVINRPTDICLGEVLRQMDIGQAADEVEHQIVLAGGPVQQERGFVLHAPCQEWRSTLEASDELAITTSRDILEAIAKNQGPLESVVSLGYSGWGPGQLEEEIAENCWLNGPASSEIIFHTPLAERWHRAAELMGIDFSLLSTEVGHA